MMKMKLSRITTQSLLLTALTSLGIAILYPSLDQRNAFPNLQSSTAIAQEVDELRRACSQTADSRLFARTELFFGLSKPNGSEVTEAEFQQFLNREVTPRFPDGLTLISGQGQFRNSRGTLVKEPAKLLILLYPIEQAIPNSQKIQQIRRIYKTNFQQESVLRTDEQSCVSF